MPIKTLALHSTMTTNEITLGVVLENVGRENMVNLDPRAWVRKISGGSVMGFMDFLDKALVKVGEAATKISEIDNEAQNLRGEYEHLSDSELMGQYKGNFIKKVAIGRILEERGYKLNNGHWYR